MAVITAITIWSVNANEGENRSDIGNELTPTAKNKRNPYVDIFVAIITVPTLILLALLLDANIQDNFESSTSVETKSSFIVLIFGFGFLVLSLLVCGCIVHKMGMSRWRRGETNEDDTSNSARGSGQEVNSANGTPNNCIHVIDLPPNYDTAMRSCKYEAPAPPYSPSMSKFPAIYETGRRNLQEIIDRRETLSVQHI